MYKINWNILPVVVFWWAHLSKAAPWFAVCWPICRIATWFSFFFLTLVVVSNSVFSTYCCESKSKMFIEIVHCFQSAYFLFMSCCRCLSWVSDFDLWIYLNSLEHVHRYYALFNRRTHSICSGFFVYIDFSSAYFLLLYSVRRWKIAVLLIDKITFEDS